MVDSTTLLMRLAAEVALLRGMGRPALERVLHRASRVGRAKGEHFFDDGEDGASFYVLMSGCVAVQKRSGETWVTLVTMQAGEAFGEMTLIGDRVRSARVLALDDCVALHIQNRALENDHEVLSTLYRNIARVQTRRLRAFNSELAEYRAMRMPAAEPAAEADEGEAPSAEGGGDATAA